MGEIVCLWVVPFFHFRKTLGACAIIAVIGFVTFFHLGKTISTVQCTKNIVLSVDVRLVPLFHFVKTLHVCVD